METTVQSIASLRRLALYYHEQGDADKARDYAAKYCSVDPDIFGSDSGLSGILPESVKVNQSSSDNIFPAWTQERPILITGSHRSGTTWVGRMLALSSRVGYINEPFSPICRPGICNASFDKWFTYLNDTNAEPFYESLRKTYRFRYNLSAEIEKIRLTSLQTGQYSTEEMQMLEEHRRFAHLHMNNAIPLLKDPIAIFSAEWLAKTFDMRVLVLIRHPAAFAASIKRLGWDIPFNNLLSQPLLMDGCLKSYADLINDYAAHPRDIVDQAALFWNCVYHTVGLYQSRHEDWIFVRHEDIADDPLTYFKHFYDLWDLGFDDQTASEIDRHSRSSNPKGWIDGESPHITIMDSRATIKGWKDKLNADEIDRIREHTDEISNRYYSELDW